MHNISVWCNVFSLKINKNVEITIASKRMILFLFFKAFEYHAVLIFNKYFTNYASSCKVIGHSYSLYMTYIYSDVLYLEMCQVCIIKY